MAGNMAVTVFLVLALVVGVFFNAFLLVNFKQRKRMRTIMTAPSCILYVHLAIIDLIAMVLWTIPTAAYATVGNGSVPGFVCDMQVCVRLFCNTTNVVTLMIFMFERFVRIFKPSKHREIFFDIVVLLMILGVYIYAASLMSFPLWGWGLIKYFEKEYQCSIGFEESPSYYDFSIAMNLGIPGGLILVGYAAILIRVFFLKRKAGPNGKIVLEENFEVIGDSYSDRLKKLYESFKDPESKLFSQKTGENATFEDTSYLDSDGFDSEEDDDDDEKEGKKNSAMKVGDDEEKSRKMPPRKCYYLGKNDMGLTHMYALLSAIYMVLWIPHYVRFYQDTYQYYETTPSDGFILAAVCLSHLGSVYKVPFYLMSHTVRGAFKKTLGIGQNEKNKKRAHQEVANQN